MSLTENFLKDTLVTHAERRERWDKLAGIVGKLWNSERSMNVTYAPRDI